MLEGSVDVRSFSLSQPVFRPPPLCDRPGWHLVAVGVTPKLMIARRSAPAISLMKDGLGAVLLQRSVELCKIRAITMTIRREGQCLFNVVIYVARRSRVRRAEESALRCCSSTPQRAETNIETCPQKWRRHSFYIMP